jgi:carbon-monoxide dehydrogenase medium subunit
MPHVAHAAIRNRGTIGGSLAFADPAAELPACAVALEARLVAESPQGRRVMKAEDFFRDLFQTALRPDEILVAIEIPVVRPRVRHEFAELARRHGDYAIVGVAMSGTFSDGIFEGGRMAYFGMGNTPILARRAMTELNGHPNSPETRDRILDALEDEFEPPEDLNASAQMRVHLAKVLTQRVLGRFDL